MKRLFLAMFVAAVSPFFVQAQSDYTAEGWKTPVLPSTLIVVPPSVEYNETANRADFVELLETLPNVPASLANDVRFQKETWAKDVRFNRDVWCFELAFRPIRVVAVDIPNKDGHLDRKPVWYMVYCVRNVGGAAIQQTGAGGRTEFVVKPNPVNGLVGGGLASKLNEPTTYPIQHDVTVEKCTCEFCTENKVPIKIVINELTLDTPLNLRGEAGTYQPQPIDETKPLRFVPQFVLASDRIVTASQSSVDPETGEITSTEEVTRVAYTDCVIPLALDVIDKREGRTEPLETSVSIATRDIAVGESVWGVAMWTDIHPKLTKFSVYVSGLTNAYRWEDEAGVYQAGDEPGTGRRMQRKTLKINWWRMGDGYKISESQIRYGWEGDVDYEWVYR
ncbi:MAG: hypothetical protein ACRC46_02100 [Thermoguttaceae bacterium]